MIKVRMVIMSHLSDVQESMHSPSARETNRTRINFAKWLLLKYPNTDQEIDPDVEFSLYMKMVSGLYESINNNR